MPFLVVGLSVWELATAKLIHLKNFREDKSGSIVGFGRGSVSIPSSKILDVEKIRIVTSSQRSVDE